MSSAHAAAADHGPRRVPRPRGPAAHQPEGVLGGGLGMSNDNALRGDTALARRELETLYGLPAVHLRITGARIVGRGSKASVDIYLSDDSTIMFESIRDASR